jgi:hypothetical protein
MSDDRPLQEDDRVPTGKLLWVGAITVAGTVGCLLWVYLVMKPFTRAQRGPERPAEVIAPASPPRPEIQPKPMPDSDFRQLGVEPGFFAAEYGKKAERLESYGWVDRGRGIARIPVTRAMELLLEREAASKEGAR